MKKLIKNVIRGVFYCTLALVGLPLVVIGSSIGFLLGGAWSGFISGWRISHRLHR